ncbi:MAG: hypothetical protein DCF16_05970 [Alphaproteobacteria bacterium]|nr:MAG: hypothetical protein DCF16_05970 [Alphaproteobacteria bacterium]
MTVLALDACGRFSVAAIQRGGETLYATGTAGRGAVRSVYSSVDLSLERAGVKPAELNAIVLNTGPGSWTATRIAVTYCAALAFGAGVRVFGASGFDIGRRLDAAGVAFIDQLGKTVAEGDAAPGFTVNLFADVDAETYLETRRAWLGEMLKLGHEKFAAGEVGDPLELRTTYFQEFLTGAKR